MPSNTVSGKLTEEEFDDYVNLTLRAIEDRCGHLIDRLNARKNTDSRAFAREYLLDIMEDLAELQQDHFPGITH